MDTATERKFREMESKLIKKLVLKGARNVAEIIGFHESQIARWQRPQRIDDISFIEKMARFLVAIEFEIPEQEVVMTGEDAKALLAALELIRYPKRKTSVAPTTEASNQIEMSI
ncbi:MULTISPECIES: CII family transcriptional regulator [Photorhabdus]|uniref:Similarities with transcription activator protein c1 n=2 Tax=Photorhabdus asymbiotica TaxID=291112 RepID=C7BH52_PHOAA|nr:CII family transcriptional regulator [Photorhabdus asymbiotica]RKS59518.1 bacteriophage CII protein [Photorhabdus asymbiotica]CAQ85218.1 similarities with transcription activator protein c1 from phage [Photorhabdus asymbiotica]CAQ85661.1 similarities with transcription activator protein c1 [Photorhabdus asymbiotica]